jgi:transcriptional regulator
MPTERGDLLRGTLEMLILRNLEDGPMHGYGITERLQRVSGDVLTVDEGSLYPALYRMQKRGLVTSEWGKSENNRKARFYSITEKGRAHLEEVSATWERFSEAVSRAMAT